MSDAVPPHRPNWEPLRPFFNKIRPVDDCVRSVPAMGAMLDQMSASWRQGLAQLGVDVNDERLLHAAIVGAAEVLLVAANHPLVDREGEALVHSCAMSTIAHLARFAPDDVRTGATS